MQAVKKIFSHGDDSNSSPSGHFNSASETTANSHSATHPSNTPNHAAPSAPAKLAEKVAGVDPSHAAGARADSASYSGNSRGTGTHVVGGSDNTSTAQNPLSSTSNGLDSERNTHSSHSSSGLTDGSRDSGLTSGSHSHGRDSGLTGSRDTGLTGSHNTSSGLAGSHNNTTSHGGVAGRAEQALEQHAAPPAHGHKHSTEHTHLDEAHARDATHDHKHLTPVVHEKHQVHETEEVTRQREVDRHVHHVQHHVQPVLDEQHASEVHRENVVPTTHIEEKHVSSAEDKAALAGLSRHHDTHDELRKDRVVVDKGEVVNENVTHHVHHAVQPIIERQTHEHHVLHTTIPTAQTIHESPIVHQSVEHEPMHIKDFVKGGGDLKSKLTHETAGILNEGECARKVDGPAEALLEKLHLKSEHHAVSTGTTGSTGTHGLTGSSGSHGLTGNNERSSLTGNNERSGLTGSAGSHGLTGNNSKHSGLTGNTEHSGLAGNNERSGLAGAAERLTGDNTERSRDDTTRAI